MEMWNSALGDLPRSLSFTLEVLPNTQCLSHRGKFPLLPIAYGGYSRFRAKQQIPTIHSPVSCAKSHLSTPLYGFGVYAEQFLLLGQVLVATILMTASQKEQHPHSTNGQHLIVILDLRSPPATYFRCNGPTCAHLDLTWDAVSSPLPHTRVSVLCSPGAVPCGEV